MKTYEMMMLAENHGGTYQSSCFLYNKEKGFHYENGIKCKEIMMPINDFINVNDWKKTDVLNPCPFCGKTKLIVGTENELKLQDKTNEGYYTVCCSYNKGGCGATGGYRKTKEEAIKMWNSRV